MQRRAKTEDHCVIASNPDETSQQLPILPVTTNGINPPDADGSPYQLTVQPKLKPRTRTNSDTLNRRPLNWSLPIFPGLGLLLGFAAGVCLSVSSLVVKMITDTNPMMFLFVRSIIQLVFFLPFAISQRLSMPRGADQLWPLFGRAFFGSLGMSALYFAISMLPLADAMTIAFSSPVFVSIFAFIFLKEPCGIFNSVMIVIALTGVVLVSKPTFIFGGADDESILRLEGSLAALACTVAQAFVYIFLRKLRKVPSVTVITSFSLITMVWSGLVLLAIWDLRYPKCGRDAVLIVLGGLFACGGQYFITTAAQIELAGPLSLVRTTDIFMAFILQVLILNHMPTWNSILGAIIILICVLVLGLKKWRSERPETFRAIEDKLSCLTGEKSKKCPDDPKVLEDIQI